METIGPGSSVGIATGYGLDGPGMESQWGWDFPHLSLLALGPGFLYNGYRVFLGVKSGRSVTLTPHRLLVLWSWKGRTIPLHPLWAVRPVQNLSAYTRVHFTLPYFYGLMIRGSVPDSSKEFSLIQIAHTSSTALPFSSSADTGVLCAGVRPPVWR
jgi:hypothetical protein